LENNNSGNETRNGRSGKHPSRLTAKAAGIAVATAHTGGNQSEQQDCPIVGIGASAGGLQALLQMFESMPETTGLAFVVIQHLDAQNDSACLHFEQSDAYGCQ
jgi:two-component system CheB/CheR fusion protein